MRYLIFLLLLNTASSSYIIAQDTLQDKQLKVEHNLHSQNFVMEGESIASQTLEDRMRVRKVNGVSIAVIDGNKIVWSKGYGSRDISASNNPVDTTTVFQCASIGKVITSLAVLHLVKEKRISLDEPVNGKLKNWKVPENDKTVEKKVTFRTLLSHTAGFDDDYGFEGYAAHSTLPTLLQMLNSESPANTNKKLTVKTVPGTVERYSGGGFLIIQQLIEDITGVSFDRYVDSIIFKPLLMLHTTYNYYPDEISGLLIARGHDEKGKIDKKRKYHVYPEMAAAGAWTTANDLARLVLEIQKEYKGFSESVADSMLVRQMLTPQINTTGMGIHFKGSADVAAFWHSGNNAGYTGLLFGTTTGQGAIVLTNSDDGAWFALEVIRSIADTYNWQTMQTHYIKPTTSTEYDLFAGEYEKNGTHLSIGKNNDGLFLNSSSGNKGYTLYQLRDGSFMIKEKPEHLRLLFIKESDKVIGLRFFQDCGRATGTLQKVLQ